MNCVRIFLYFFLFCTISDSYPSYSNCQASKAILAENANLIKIFCPTEFLRTGVIEINENGRRYTAMGVAAKEKKIKAIEVLYSLGVKFSDYVIESNGKTYTMSQWFFYQSTKNESNEDGYEVSDDEDNEVLGPVKGKCFELVVEEYARTLKKNEDGSYGNKEWKCHPQPDFYYPEQSKIIDYVDI